MTFSKEKISRRFLWAIMSITIIPIVIMGFEAHMIAERALLKTASLHMATIAEDHAKHLDTWMRERLNDLDVLARLPVVRKKINEYGLASVSGASRDAASDALKETLATTQQRSPAYESLAIVSLEDETIAAGRTPPNDFSISQRAEIIHRLRVMDSAFGSLCRGDDQKWHILVGVRIVDESGGPLAFIVAELDLSKTVDPIMADHIGMGETGETYIVDERGAIISELRFLGRQETFGRAFDSQGIRLALDRQKGTDVYNNYMGHEVLGAYLWLERYNWGIIAEIGKGEVLWPLTWIKRISFVVALLTGVICFIMAFIVSRKVTRPICEVSGAALKMAEGDLEQRISFSGQDEVGMLAQSFNKMARQMSLLIHSLHQREQSLQNAYDDLLEAQHQLVQAEKMSAIGELVACVAHEMRNPLASVKLNLEILEAGLENDAELGEHCRIALDQAVQLERMFSELLNYSRPLALNKRKVSVEELVNRSIDQLRGEFLAHDINIAKKITLDALVYADPDMIFQVLVNLLRNAIEASPPGATVEIEAGEDGSGKNKAAVIRIIDYGMGISARNLQRLFKPFFTTKKHGTGLGLCIVKKILDSHQGTISVASEESLKTVMRVCLPIV